MSLRDELPCGVARLRGPQTHFRRNHRATVQMTTNTFSQIRTATRTQMRAVAEKVHTKLRLSETLGARVALRDRVTPTVPEKECTLLRAQTTRCAAVHVGDHTAAKLNSIDASDYLQASRTLWVRHVWTLGVRRPLVNSAFDQLT